MEQINTLLNLPEYATASDRACAVYELLQETDNIQAARSTAESQLLALREATSHIFAESICAARGITDADAQEDIRAAWCADPYAALNALAGENINAANPYGCNQYGHGFKEPHGAAGGRGQKTFGFFGETVDKKRKKDLAVVEDATRAFKEAKRAEEAAYKKREATSYDTPEYEEAENAWEEANEELIQEAKKARHVRNEARKNGYELEEADDKRIDETLRETDREEEKKRETEENSKRFREQMRKRGAKYNEGLRAWVKASNAAHRSLEELLEEEEIVKSSHYDGYEIDEEVDAANPYGCNQYGHEWRGKHGEGWQPRGDRQRDKKKEENKKKESPDEQKGKNLSDALKKIAPRTDKNGQGLMPFAENENKSDAEIDNFEKASTDKKREILSGWKQKVRDARHRKDGTEKKEEENLFNKIRKLGKKRGWSKEKLDSTLKGLELDLKSDYDTFLI